MVKTSLSWGFAEMYSSPGRTIFYNLSNFFLKPFFLNNANYMKNQKQKLKCRNFYE